MPNERSSAGNLILELVFSTAAVLVLSTVLFRLRFIPFVNEYISVFVAVALLYIPVFVLWKRGRDVDFVDRNLSSFARSVIVFIITSIVVFPVFFFAAHFWQIYVWGYKGFRLLSFPMLGGVVLYQIFLVALPEEFFFRGYFQSSLNMICRPRWKILGVQLGFSWILTALVFAFAHSIIVYRWWHFAIFFPALLFGYLRERTGSITAPVLFHALSNILISWFTRGYY